MVNVILHAPADKKVIVHPKGESFVNYTKTLMEGGFCLESITSAQYRGRLGGGGCLFASFSAPEKVREKVSWFVLCARALGFAACRSALPLSTEGTKEPTGRKNE